MKPTACAYIRVSREKEDGISPEQQKEKAELQAKLLGLDLVQVYQDLDISGRSDNRDAFQEMINDIKKNKYTACLVYKLDRFCRNVSDFHHYVRILESHGCRLISISQNIDTSTPVGRLLRNILADFAQFESEMIGERIRDNKVANARRGRWNGGHAPYGYKVVEKRLVINEEEAAVVRLIYNLRAHGWGILAITKELNARGYKARRGTTWGVHWSESTIKYMLRNRVYIGELVYGKEVVPDAVPAIVDKDIFQKAQTVGRLPSRSQATAHLLSGLLYCGDCGKISFQVSYNGPNLVRRYTCRTKRWKNHAACSSPLLDADSLETAVTSQIFALAKDPANLESETLKQLYEYKKSKRVTLKDIARVQKELERVQRTMRRLFSDYYDAGIITREQFVAKNDEYIQQEAALKATLESFGQVDRQIEAYENDIEVFKANLMQLNENWAYLPPEEKRMAVRSLVREIVVNPDDIEIDFFLFKQKVHPSRKSRGTLYF